MRPQKPRQGTHKVLADLVAEVGANAETGQSAAEVVADFIDVDAGTLYKLLDPDQRGDVSYARVRLVTERFKVKAAADDLARLAGGIFVQIEPAVPSKAIWHRSSREIGEEIQNVLGGLMTALEDDGDVDSEEIKTLRLRAMIRDAHGALAALDANLARVEDAETESGQILRMTGAARNG